MKVSLTEDAAPRPGTKGPCMEISSECVTLSIPSNAQYLGVLRTFSRGLCETWGWSEADTSGIVLAIHEACANVIEHCYGGDPAQRIDLSLCCTPASLIVDIRDYGRQQDVTAFRPRALDEVRPRGLGTHFIRTLMDDVTYHSSDAGTHLRMTKRRSGSCKSP